jgi:hypothetical protein
MQTKVIVTNPAQNEGHLKVKIMKGDEQRSFFMIPPGDMRAVFLDKDHSVVTEPA